MANDENRRLTQPGISDSSIRSLTTSEAVRRELSFVVRATTNGPCSLQSRLPSVSWLTSCRGAVLTIVFVVISVLSISRSPSLLRVKTVARDFGTDRYLSRHKVRGF